jgi:predicted ATP-dependent serine protease
MRSGSTLTMMPRELPPKGGGADTPTDPASVFFGEVGLSGEVRQVAHAEARLKEAQKLGFARAALPRRVVLRRFDLYGA